MPEKPKLFSKDEWNLIWLPNHKLLDIVHKDDLPKVKLEFDVMFYGISKQELLENFLQELNRLIFAEQFQIYLKKVDEES